MCPRRFAAATCSLEQEQTKTERVGSPWAWTKTWERGIRPDQASRPELLSEFRALGGSSEQLRLTVWHVHSSEFSTPARPGYPRMTSVR